MTGSFSKGKGGDKYPSYHHSKNHKPQFGVSRDDVNKAMENFLQNIKFTPSFLEELERSLRF
jgi:hypothetical protein